MGALSPGDVLDVKSLVSSNGATTVSVVGPQEIAPITRIGRKRAALVFMSPSGGPVHWKHS